MITLLNAEPDAALAARVRQLLQDANYKLDTATSEQSNLTILILSPATLTDSALQTRLYSALDQGHHIIPVLSEPLTLPKSINHLAPILASAPDAVEALRSAVDQALAPDAPMPLKVLTPATRRSNSGVGLIVGIFALIMFAAGIIGVGLLDIEAPVAEYNLVDTEVALTRDFLIGPTLESYLRFLPGSLEQAAEYPATVEAVPTRLRPFVAATATAVAIDQQD